MWYTHTHTRTCISIFSVQTDLFGRLQTDHLSIQSYPYNMNCFQANIINHFHFAVSNETVSPEAVVNEAIEMSTNTKYLLMEFYLQLCLECLNFPRVVCKGKMILDGFSFRFWNFWRQWDWNNTHLLSNMNKLTEIFSLHVMMASWKTNWRLPQDCTAFVYWEWLMEITQSTT